MSCMECLVQSPIISHRIEYGLALIGGGSPKFLKGIFLHHTWKWQELNLGLSAFKRDALPLGYNHFAFIFQSSWFCYTNVSALIFITFKIHFLQGAPGGILCPQSFPLPPGKIPSPSMGLLKSAWGILMVQSWDSTWAFWYRVSQVCLTAPAPKAPALVQHRIGTVN